MRNIDHEKVSAALHAYVRGGLAETEAAEIEAHLASCTDCRRESDAVRALTAAPEPLMSDVERAALHRDVRTAVAVAPRSRTHTWGRRFAPALGAAAMLALIAVGIITLDRDPRVGQPVGSEAGTGGDAGPPAQEAGSSDVADETAADRGTTATTTGGGAAGSGAADGSGPDHRTRRSRVVGARAAQPESAQLSGVADRDVGEVRILRRSFAAATFDPESLVGTRKTASDTAFATALDTLHANAPAGAIRDTIRRCAELTISTSPFDVIPTSATVYRRDDIVVITFVWIDESDALNYEVRGWRAGACDRPSPIYRRGRVP